MPDPTASAPLQPPSIPALAQAAAVAFGEDVALEEGALRLSFRALAAAALRSTAAFLAAGVRPGDRVAVWAPNVHEWILAALGLQGAGGVLVPLNTRFKGTEAGQILERSGARLLFTVEELLGQRYLELLTASHGGPAAGPDGRARPFERLPALEGVVLLRGGGSGAEPASQEAQNGPAPPQDSGLAHVRPSEPEGRREPASITTWAEFLARGAAVTDADATAAIDAVRGDQLSDLLFTSGTTGRAKGVMTTHAQNLRAFTAWSGVVGLRRGDRYLIVNPFFHAFGYKAGWVAALLRGATILPHLVFDAGQVLERIAADRVTMLPGPPTLFQMLLARPERTERDLSSLRLAVTGAAVIPVELVRRMRSDLGFRTVITGYGLTETCGVVTMCRDGDDPELIARTSGCAIPDVEVRCVTDDGVEVARGEAGEVVVRGYNVMLGYFDDAAETAATIDAEGWLHTGDIGVMDERGYLRITDRKKDLFIVGGFNCYPAEIEQLLLGHPEVGQAAVVGAPDERLGEVGVAFVVPRAGASPTESGVIEWARKAMANYKVPRRVFVVEALPLNASGKVLKTELRARVAADASTEAEHGAGAPSS